MCVLDKKDFVPVVDIQMTRSPQLDKENANIILGKRRYGHDGSIWDNKPKVKNRTPNQALRIKVSGAIDDSGYSKGKATRMQVYRSRMRTNGVGQGVQGAPRI